MFLEQLLTTKFVATVVLAFLLMGIRYGIALYIRRSRWNWTSQQRLKWIAISRIFVSFIVFISVIYLWGETIQGFAVSVFAIAFAIVFSVKEICMCCNGSLVRFLGKSFELGDRIQIGDIRGNVIATSLLSTTVQEVGKGSSNRQFTGRMITFPNNLFLIESVHNESFLKHFYLLHIDIPVKIINNWQKAKNLLIQIAQQEIKPHVKQVKRNMRDFERLYGLEMLKVEPYVTIEMHGFDSVILHLRMAVPSNLKEHLEQVILTRYLDKIF